MIIPTTWHIFLSTPKSSCKVNVKGPSIHPVWAMLLKFFPGDVPWNFAGRFLVDKSGTPVKRYDKSASYDQIETDIKSML